MSIQNRVSLIHWLAVLVALLPGLLVYGVRCYLSWSYLTESSALRYDLICFLSLLTVVPAVGISTLVYAIKRRKRFTPLLVYAVGLVIAIQAPIPVYATSTEIAFHQWRQDYQAIVTLIQQGVIKPPASGGSTSLPKAQTRLSEGGIFIDSEPNLAIEFVPSSFYKPLVYVENPSQIQTQCNNHELVKVIRQLEVNWYVCQRDIN